MVDSNDVVFEILTRVALQELGNCRSVSREWNLITYEPRFTDLHPLRTATVSGYLLQSDYCGIKFKHTFVSSDDAPNHTFVFSLNFLPHKPSVIEIEACQTGIVFCRASSGSHYYKYYVCKPATKDWIKIPNPKTRYMSDKVAMVVKRLNPSVHYKILRVSSMWDCRAHYKVGLTYLCEIFDSEVGRWKRLKDIVLPYGYGDGFSSGRPVVVGGVAYWNSWKFETLFMFDMYEEKWNMVPLVIPEKEKYGGMRLTSHDGRLGLFCESLAGDFYDIWVWEKTHNEWKKKVRVKFDDQDKLHSPILALKNDNLLLFSQSGKRFSFYNACDHTEKVIELPHHYNHPEAFYLHSDYEKCKF